MSERPRGRDPVRIGGWWLRAAVLPALLGVVVSGNLDARSLPLVGAERESAVLLLDGQAYFGHLDDSGENGWLVLRDVYYLQDAKGAPTNVAVSVVRRGGEAHDPADGMRINRDRVLAVERVGADSGVARAIAVQRGLLGTKPASIALNPQTIGDAGALAAQRLSAEHAIARGFAAQADQLNKMNNDLVLPISKDEAAAITQKALADLRTVRHDALAALGLATGLRANDAESYARIAEARVEGQSFVNEPGLLLAPDLEAVIARATTLYAQVGDAAAKQLTQPRTTATPSASPVTPSPSPSRP